MHPHLRKLIACIELEEKEQANRFRLDQHHSLKALKADGLALHPIIISRRNFGYADYPEVSFRLNFPAETGSFRDGVAIECFREGEEPVKGIMLSMEGRSGEFRLFAPDHPEWLEDGHVGIKLAPDTRTTTILKKTLEQISNRKDLTKIFELLHGGEKQLQRDQTPDNKPILKNTTLNPSQVDAIQAVMNNDDICIIHGPPGTGKTTTLAEAVFQLVQKGERLLVAAPSNAAVDHICSGLIKNGVRVLRVGNSGKVREDILPYTPEGKLANSALQREIKALSKRADEFRRMANRYKRNFGRDEREQRNLLLKEVRNLHAEIRKLHEYHEEKLYTDAQVICGTPIGLYDAGIHKMEFHTLIIDEAGQCMEPLAWSIMHLAPRLVLAGDHWQLPPTVLSMEAAKLGLGISILEVGMNALARIYLLNVQYRMREAIAGFSSAYFYGGLLRTVESLGDKGIHLQFIDTAGTGFHEEQGADGSSLRNPGELELTKNILEQFAWPPDKTAFISPYSGQVAEAKEMLPNLARISTIDSFQGQEMDHVMVSLVRSNEDGVIGFLKDYRRLNVAITRAKEQLVVIGDSSTIAQDPFFNAFLHYAESRGSYRTAWEFMSF